MKKITFLTLHLGYGGIENAVTTLANSLNSKYDIEIISVYKRFDEPVFKLNKNIKVKYLISHSDIKLADSKNLLDYLKLLFLKRKDSFLETRLVKKFIKKCQSDIIISTNIKYNLIIGKYASNESLKIGWEHKYHNNNKKYIKKVIASTINLDYFVLISNFLYKFYSERVVDTKCQYVYIPNALANIPKKTSELNSKNIISIGKLSKEKAYIDLVEIFKYVSLKYPDWKLNIIGDGPERNLVEEKIKKYQLTENVILHGFQDKNYIKKFFEQSSIFIMSSTTESFGIAILEAFSYGVPCVAFDDALGAKELISNNWDGYLISNFDKEKMTKKIIDLIKNDNRRIIMGNNAHKKSLKYSPDTVRDMWLEVLQVKEGK